MSRFRPAGFRKGQTAWRRASRPDSGRPARRRSTAFRDGWTAWRRRASRNPAAPRNAVSLWEAGAPRSAASRWEAAANPWLGAIARCSRTGSSNPSPSSRESRTKSNGALRGCRGEVRAGTAGKSGSLRMDKTRIGNLIIDGHGRRDRPPELKKTSDCRRDRKGQGEARRALRGDGRYATTPPPGN